MNSRCNFLLFLSLLGMTALAVADDESSSTLPDAGSVSVPAVGDLPAQILTPQITSQLLLAEIALSRGNLQLALNAYLDLAYTTRDPRIARRATEIAVYSHQSDAALQAAQLWVEIDPKSAMARQMLSGLLIAANRTEELAPQLTQMLALDKENLGDALLRLGRMLARLPDRPSIQRLVEQVTAPYEQVPEAHFARAEVTSDEAHALKEINRALQLRPDWEQAVLFKAHLLQKNHGQVIEVLRSFLDAHPKARDVRLAYARALVGDNHYEDARREFRALLDGEHVDPDIIYAVAILSLQLKDRSQAENQFRRLLELDYADSNNIRLQLGQMAEEDKRWDDALRWFREVTPGEQYLTAKARSANVLAQQGRIEEGRRLLQDAGTAFPRDRSQFQVAEAILLRDAARPQDAYDVLAAALAGTPDQTDLLYESALLAERLGKMDVLEHNLRRIIKLKPDNAQAYNALGYSFADHNERLDEAQQLINQALTISPDDPFILDSKGWVLFRRGDNPGALEVLQHAFVIRADPEIAAHIGEVQWALGRHADAEKTWRDAIKANPDNEALAETIKKFKH